MNFITRLLTRFGSAGSQGSEGSIKETESGPKPTKLTDLPTELVLMILDYVSPVDAACLTLCNHHFLRVLGTQSWTALDSGLRELFLTRLTSDLPFHFFCHFCSVIHSCKDMLPPGPASLRYKYPARHSEELRMLHTNSLVGLVSVHEGRWCWYHFNFFHLQLAMKRYYNGPPHGLSTESLSFTQVEFSATNSITTLSSVEGRICQGPSLCMRFQNWALFNAATLDEFLSQIDFIFICGHDTMTWHLSYFAPLFAAALEGPRTDENGMRIDPEIHRCSRCGVEYQIEVMNYGDLGLALVITKWLDLGPGLRPTDAEWNGLFDRQIKQLPAGKSVGDTRSLFEREPGLSLESLTWKNKSCLLTESYKKSMDQLDNRTWILQGPRGPC
ncbi:hypothetical protein FQN51_008758 [Onygenales sp. PD_10]|nr:hypothetical protein FQN51_008758 [Onygenales sp. PD_10]